MRCTPLSCTPLPCTLSLYTAPPPSPVAGPALASALPCLSSIRARPCRVRAVVARLHRRSRGSKPRTSPSFDPGCTDSRRSPSLPRPAPPVCRNSSRALRSSACSRRQLNARSRRLLRARAATPARFRTRVCSMPPEPRTHAPAA
jgi:hypothetical protein